MALDPSAFVAKLAKDYGGALLRYLRGRARSKADAEDIAQETYANLLRFGKQEIIRDPRAYLFQAATYTLYRNAAERANDDAARQALLCELQDEHVPSAETLAEALVKQEHLQSALGGLSAKCRAVVLLHIHYQMTQPEIGELFGISVSMVKKYLERGLAHCRQCVSELERGQS